MKYFLGICLLLILSNNDVVGQATLDSSLVQSIAKHTEKQKKRLKRELLNEGLYHPIFLEYKVDEYQIETYLNRKALNASDTRAYISELLLAEKRYQLLVAKYYNLLLSKVDIDVQESLDDAQSTWQLYRDAEQQVNMDLNPEAFGYQEIKLEKMAERHLSITKYRVLDIVDYLSRINEKR